MNNDEDELKTHLEERVIRHIIELEKNNEKESQIELTRDEESALSTFEEEKTRILEEAERLGVQINDIDIITPFDVEHYQGYLEAYTELFDETQSKHKQPPKGKVNLSHQFSVGINNEDDWRKRPFNSTEHMIDFLVSRKELGEIEFAKQKPNLQLVNEGRKASEMLEELWATAIESGRTITSSKKLVFEENPETFREKGGYVKDIRKLRLMR
jgi:hypothetical protein